ncbi:MAG: glycosyltransferase family 4 protein [Ilumatobacter sp.]
MLEVSIDSGPLHGSRTGIGVAVQGTIDALSARSDLGLRRYVCSARAKTSAGERRLPVPAAAAHRLWARSRRFPMDRWLGNPDIVHGTNYVVPPTRAPAVVSVYDCWFLDNPELAAPGFDHMAAVLRRSVDDGATVVTSSEATSERVRELLETEPITVHLGPPSRTTAPERRPPDVDPALENHPFVVSIGTVERRKNVPTLLAAFERLAAELPDVRLVIAGRDGDDAPAVERMLARLDGSTGARVLRMRDVDEPTKQWLLEHAAVLAYPSLDEGFGFPILEAQLARTPVVASSAGSIPEVSGPAALLSLPTDPDALAANLHWVVTSESQSNRMIAMGARNAERFSWEATADALAGEYRRLVDHG